MAPSWQNFLDGIFGAFYVMTEQNIHTQESSWGTIKRTILYLLDAGQVLRAIFLQEYGWSLEITGTANKLDLIGFLDDLIPHPPIQSGLFFGVAAVLVALAVVDTALVVRVFQRGKTTTHLWPVMALRFLVATLVTTFFISIFKFLLFPIDCISSGLDSGTLSSWLKGPHAPCTPWGIPEVAVTVPALVLAIVFAGFSVMTTLLSFEVNPISEVPGDCFTGRVETVWSTVRIVIVLARYFQQGITPVGAMVIVCVHVSFLLGFHVSTMPFHSHGFNELRGGIYAAVLWAAIATAIVASSSGQSSQGASTSMQWALIAMIPIVFSFGTNLVRRRRNQILLNVKRLRAEYLKDSVESVTALRTRSSPTVRKRNFYGDFFDTTSRLNRAFESPSFASAAVRILLYEKDERDLAFLDYLFQRGLEEHPDAKEYQILHLIFLRFVFQDEQSAVWQEKITKMLNFDLAVDLKYALYAVGRKAFQQDAGLTMGKDSISAINLMEFSGKMMHVRKKHQECIALLKGIWDKSGKSKHEVSFELVQSLLDRFNLVSNAISHTSKCYDQLLEKFPGSASLRLDYASFCDVVLNEPNKAEMLRNGAELLESGDGGCAVEGGEESRSTSKCSSNMSFRSSQRSFVLSWSEAVMCAQVRALTRFRTLISGLGLFLLVFSTCGFVVMEVYLYQEVTETRLNFLRGNEGYRQNVFQSCVLLRDLHLLTNESDPITSERLSTCRGKIQALSQRLLAFHTSNYQATPTQSITSFFQEAHSTEIVPVPGSGHYVLRNVSFWDLGDDVFSAISDAAHTSPDDFHNPDFSIDGMSQNKRAVVFVYDNVWNVKAGVDSFFLLIQSEIDLLAGITATTSQALLVVSALIICAIAYLVLRDVGSVFPTCQHGAVGCALLHSLPVTALRKVYRYYNACERRIALMDDEIADKIQLELMQDEAETTCDGKPGEGSDDWRGADYDGKDYERFEEGHANDSEGAAAEDKTRRSSVAFREQPCMVGTIQTREGCAQRPVASAICIASTGELHTETGAIDLANNMASQTNSNVPFDNNVHSDGRLKDTESNEMLMLSAKEQQVTSESRPVFGGDGCASNATTMQLTHQNVRLYLLNESFRTSVLAGRGGAQAVPPASSGMLFDPFAGEQSRPGDEGNAGDNIGDDGTSVDGAGEKSNRLTRWSSQEYSNARSEIDSAQGDVAEADRPSPYALQHDETDAGMTTTTCKAASRSNSGYQSYGADGGMLLAAQFRRAVSLPPPQGVTDKVGSSSGQSLSDSLMSINGGSPLGRDVSHQQDSGGGQEVETELHSGQICSSGRLTAKVVQTCNAMADSAYGITSVNGHFAKSTRPLPPAQDSFRSGGPAVQSQRRSSRSLVRMVQRTGARILGVLSGRRRQYAPAEHDEDDPNDVDFRTHVSRATVDRLAWYYRVSFYRAALLLVLGLCFCSWLIPLQLIPQLINTTRLVQQTYNTIGSLLRGVFLSRELVLNDGLARKNGRAIAESLASARSGMIFAMDEFRLGGALVAIGADNLDSVYMTQYNDVMYSMFRPANHNWYSHDARLCCLSEAASRGLYKYIMYYAQSFEVVIGKYGPGSSFFKSQPDISNMDKVVLNKTRVAILDQDDDLRFILETRGNDPINGLLMVTSIFANQQRLLLEQLHEQSQLLISLFMISVVLVFYVILLRTTFAAASSEVMKAKAFVSMIPAHVLSREELTYVRNFFVTEADEAVHENPAEALYSGEGSLRESAWASGTKAHGRRDSSSVGDSAMAPLFGIARGGARRSMHLSV